MSDSSLQKLIIGSRKHARLLSAWLRSGANWHWFSLSAVLMSAILMVALLGLVVQQGAAYFWPKQLTEIVFVDAQGQNVQWFAEQLDHRQPLHELQPNEQSVDDTNHSGSVLLRYQQRSAESVVWRYQWLNKQSIVRQGYPDSLLKITTDDGLQLAGYAVALDAVALTDQLSDQPLLQQLRWLLRRGNSGQLMLQLHDGGLFEVDIRSIQRLEQPNHLNLSEKLHLFISAFWSFLYSDSPADGSASILPAIYGTILLVMLMSLLLVPVGVLTAVYLHEYSRPALLARILRIAISNLAGVPGIVIGVFVLGFFVYGLGSTADELLFPGSTASVFGGNSLLWAAVALALLNIPVVVVATEEGLARVPNELRLGALALGATRAEMIWGTVLHAARPAILTGVIMSVARAAGEVAPLLLVGVVSFSGQSLLDTDFPFVHIERPFMHLGYQIYDFSVLAGNPNEAIPKAYATTLILLALVVVLNLVAIRLRARLRRRFI